MKKISVILTATAITTVLGATAALAAGNGSRNAYGSGNQKTPAYSCTYCEDSSHCFTDADGDGICDHFHTHTTRTDSAERANNTGNGSAVQSSSSGSGSVNRITPAQTDSVSQTGAGTGNSCRYYSEDNVCPEWQHHTERGCHSGSGHRNQYHH